MINFKEHALIQEIEKHLSAIKNANIDPACAADNCYELGKLFLEGKSFVEKDPLRAKNMFAASVFLKPTYNDALVELFRFVFHDNGKPCSYKTAREILNFKCTEDSWDNPAEYGAQLNESEVNYLENLCKKEIAKLNISQIFFKRYTNGDLVDTKIITKDIELNF